MPFDKVVVGDCKQAVLLKDVEASKGARTLQEGNHCSVVQSVFDQQMPIGDSLSAGVLNNLVAVGTIEPAKAVDLPRGGVRRTGQAGPSRRQRGGLDDQRIAAEEGARRPDADATGGVRDVAARLRPGARAGQIAQAGAVADERGGADRAVDVQLAVEGDVAVEFRRADHIELGAGADGPDADVAVWIDPHAFCQVPPGDPLNAERQIHAAGVAHFAKRVDLGASAIRMTE